MKLQTEPRTELHSHPIGDFPFVSVIVPVYNGEMFLPLLLESLSQLDYPVERLEILIVDNNSSDRTAELLAASSFTTILECKPGAGAARNAGIKQAKGEFLAFTDVDCVVDRSWLKDLIAGFTDSTVGAVAGVLEPYELKNPIERYEAQRINDPGHRAAHVFLPTAVTANTMYRAAVFKRIGMFLNGTGAEETDLNWRMQSQTEYRIHFLPAGGLVWHRYRTDLKRFCRAQRIKSRTLIDLHQRWNLHVPTGRKELLRIGMATASFLPKIVGHTLRQSNSLLTTPTQVLSDSFWEAWLDILVPLNRYLGISQGRRALRAYPFKEALLRE